MSRRRIASLKERLRQRSAGALFEVRTERPPRKLSAIGRSWRHRDLCIAELIQRCSIEGHIAIVVDGLMHPVPIRIAEQIERPKPRRRHTKCGVAREPRSKVCLLYTSDA